MNVEKIVVKYFAFNTKNISIDAKGFINMGNRKELTKVSGERVNVKINAIVLTETKSEGYTRVYLNSLVEYIDVIESEKFIFEKENSNFEFHVR